MVGRRIAEIQMVGTPATRARGPLWGGCTFGRSFKAAKGLRRANGVTRPALSTVKSKATVSFEPLRGVGSNLKRTTFAGVGVPISFESGRGLQGGGAGGSSEGASGTWPWMAVQVLVGPGRGLCATRGSRIGDRRRFAVLLRNRESPGIMDPAEPGASLGFGSDSPPRWRDGDPHEPTAHCLRSIRWRSASCLRRRRSTTFPGLNPRRGTCRWSLRTCVETSFRSATQTPEAAL